MTELDVKQLEVTFEKADAELNTIENKIRCAQQQRKEEKGAKKGDIDATELASRLRNIRAEYKSIVEEAVAIQQKQQEAMQFLSSELITACQTMHKLQQQTQDKVELTEEVNELEKLTGSKINTEER